MHLDRDHAAFPGHGSVDLSDGGTGERFLIELGEHLGDGAAPSGFKLVLHLGEGNGLHPGLEGGELLNEFVRDHGHRGWR